MDAERDCGRVHPVQECVSHDHAGGGRTAVSTSSNVGCSADTASRNTGKADSEGRSSPHSAASDFMKGSSTMATPSELDSVTQMNRALLVVVKKVMVVSW
jgi:hypothetical protein